MHEYKARPLYEELAGAIQAREGMESSHAWFDKWNDRIKMFALLMPHNAKLDLDASHANRLVFQMSYHHMDENGCWDGYTDHTVIVTGALHGQFSLRISGPNRDDIKDHLHEEFDWSLRTDITYDLFLEHYPELAVQSAWEDKDGRMSQCHQAWYVLDESDGIRKRFWNDPHGARDFAARQMDAKWYASLGQSKND